MADDLSITISAKDQASAAVETIQKKIQDFGKDVAKLALGVAGPMALLQAGIGYVSDKWNEYKQAQKDAFESGSALAYDEVKRQMAVNEQLDKGLAYLLAQKKVKQELLKDSEQIKIAEKQAIEEFKKTAEYKAVEREVYRRGSTVKDREGFIRDAALEYGRKKENEAREAELKKLQGPFITDEQRTVLEEIAKINDELAKRGGKSLFDINALDRFTRNFKEESALPKQKTKEATKDDIKLTVSSLREIGGSFGGGDINTGIERQIAIAEKQLDTLNEIKDALNRGSVESQVFQQPLIDAIKETA